MLKAYNCPSGYRTIGYGHQTRSLSNISEATAEKLLREDLEPVERFVNSMDIKLTQNQFDAVCSFAFNVGTHKFSKSTFAKTLDPAELKKWIYGNNRRLPGLIKRRNEEIELFTTRDRLCLTASDWGMDWTWHDSVWGNYC